MAIMFMSGVGFLWAWEKRGPQKLEKKKRNLVGFFLGISFSIVVYYLFGLLNGLIFKSVMHYPYFLVK
jgi:hypothetical protein